MRLISASVPCFITSCLCPVLCRQLFELQRRVLGAEEKGENEKTKRVTGVLEGDIFRLHVIVTFNLAFHRRGLQYKRLCVFSEELQ